MNRLVISPKLKTAFTVCLGIGVVSFLAGFVMNPTRAWHAYVTNYYFFMSIGLGGIFFVATQYLTNAGWSGTVRRIPESFMSWFWPSLILFIPIVIGMFIQGKWGMSAVYIWTNHELVHNDHLLHLKTPYLNVPFLIARAVAFFAVWYFIGGKLVRNSLLQDQTGDVALTRQNVKFSAIFMPLFAITFSLVSFDLIMSLDPHWFSTMFGVNMFANLFLSTLAAIIIVVISMKKAGYFGESINENHTHTLGQLMFAFVVFYAYITFCQFMLIWYANLPEETSYYIRRWENGWSIVAMTILFTKFILPFLLLLPRGAKRNMNYLRKMAVWIIAASWIDMFWLVLPNYSKGPVFPILEILVFLGFLGGFGLAVTGFLSRVPVVPQKDPRAHEALHLHT
jgi:hypothetical protein